MPFVPAADREPWDRQPGETHKAYRAFEAYRALGADRTAQKAAKALGKNSVTGWSAKWGWLERAEAWDRHEARRMQEAVLLEREKEAKEMATVARGLWTLAFKDLELWHAKIDKRLAQRRGDPSKEAEPILSPSDLKNLADAGIKLARLMNDQPTAIDEQRQQLTADERRQQIRQHLNNPKVIEAMEQIAEATMPETPAKNALLDPTVLDAQLEH